MVVRRGHHHERGTGLDAGLERRQISVRRRGDVVGHPGGGVGVRGDPAQAREVLQGGGDACLRHAPHHRGAVRRHHVRGVAVLAVVVPDRRIDLTDRHGVHHGRQVQVHPGRRQLATPKLCRGLQRRRRPTALGQCLRNGRESGPGQHLDVAALLVGADEQRHPARRRRVGPCLQPVGDRSGGADTPRAAAGQDHVAHVVAADRRQGRRADTGRGAADHEQLADPLRLGHPVEHRLGAARRNTRRRRWRRRQQDSDCQRGSDAERGSDSHQQPGHSRMLHLAPPPDPPSHQTPAAPELLRRRRRRARVSTFRWGRVHHCGPRVSPRRRGHRAGRSR